MEIKDLTEWFPMMVKPRFVGVYQVKSLSNISGWYAYWCGEGWLIPHVTVNQAYERRNYDPLSMNQNKVWRGLARPIE